MFKVLYGKDKKDGYKIWMVSAKDNVITITHGKMDGKLQEKTEVISGKNLGKANETTSEQQAVLEAESRYKKQLDKGYRPTLDELEDLPILPMLAKDFHKEGHRVVWPCYGSRKLDGLRCLAIRHTDRIELRSRGGKEYNVQHIQDELMSIMKDGDMLDGELYIPGKELEEISSAVKRASNPDHAVLQYWVFDAPEEGRPFKNRLTTVESIPERAPLKNVRIVPHEVVSDEDHMRKLHKQYVSEGYEGIMLNNMFGEYLSGPSRSEDIQKYKEMIDEEFKVVGVEKDRNDNAILICFDGTANAHFNVTFGDFAKRKHQFEHPEEYAGKWLTVAYQKRYKDSRLPQFPCGKAIRECDEQGNPLE